MSQDETIHVTWYAGDTEYAASDRRIGMLQDNDFRDLAYSEVESVRTTIKTIDGERDGALGLIKTVVQLGLGVLGGFMMLIFIFSLFEGSLLGWLFFVFGILLLYGGLRGYRGWKQRSRETRDQPFVVFELGQKTTVDIDTHLERAEVNVNSETQQLEIPVPDEKTMKTVTSNVR
jgi:hypothetical protein